MSIMFICKYKNKLNNQKVQLHKVIQKKENSA